MAVGGFQYLRQYNSRPSHLFLAHPTQWKQSIILCFKLIYWFHDFCTKKFSIKKTIADNKGCDKNIFLVRIRRLSLTYDTIDILCLVYFNFSTINIINSILI